MTTKSLIAMAAMAGIALAASTIAAAAQTPPIRSEEFMVPARDAGIEIFVRNKRPEAMTNFSPDRTVVFVHGATYPAHTAFDLRLDGQSWMDYVAARGYDVYLLDLRGYGRSTRPPEMSRPAEASPPIVDTEIARRDVDTVVDFVRQRRGIAQVNLIGWSWGTAIMASYAAENPAKVSRLVLYAPVWLRNTPSPVQVQGQLGAYRTVRRDQALARWLTGVPEAKKAALIPAGWFDAWADATFATDPAGATANPPTLRAPNGVVKDGLAFWSAGRPGYDPARITAPTLLIVGEWDQDTPPYMAQALFPLLTQAAQKRLVLVGEATHTMIMERNRMQLFREVQTFLDEGLQPAQN
ncbi:alpha/beta hydrolase [Phreatobacter stygius]|uniref:Alpha/beta hydrolase n=1 Tax=Phreatobacter stygius TaxID=1940610 RepID=A0A4D7AVL9_9HYPH|nr:alpha/beta fold hydrolase [Phreatobacter stygius]QCI63821.1 alpha/beta hydrolase [Phreatobacter stygius]